jgi:E3 ubiquitin-protein ligase HERC2
LDNNSALFSWGNGQGGRLGHGNETGENMPKEIMFFKESDAVTAKIIIIEAGESNSAAITSKNELFIWGVGLHGRLGTGKTSNVLKPTQLDDLKNVKVEDINLGSNHSLCLLRNGKVLCWGSSKEGKLGLETTMDRNFTVPKEMITLDKDKIYQMAAGPFHTLALTEKGTIFSFGNSKDGKLGYEESKGNVFIPRPILSAPNFAGKSSADNDLK